jgi:hypothetical protein
MVTLKMAERPKNFGFKTNGLDYLLIALNINTEDGP